MLLLVLLFALALCTCEAWRSFLVRVLSAKRARDIQIMAAA